MANEIHAQSSNAETIELAQRNYKLLSSEDAQELSRGKILLHFGYGFPEETMSGIIEALTDLGYDFAVGELGGPEGMLDVYIDEQKGNQPFTPSDAVTYLGYVLEQNASQFKLENLD